jgi:hypothetical protein
MKGYVKYTVSLLLWVPENGSSNGISQWMYAFYATEAAIPTDMIQGHSALPAILQKKHCKHSKYSRQYKQALYHVIFKIHKNM